MWTLRSEANAARAEFEGSMWQSITDFFYVITDLSFYNGFMVFCTVAFAFALVRLVLDSTFMAVMFTPAMALFALASNYLFHVFFLGPFADKHSNIVIASAVGVVIAVLFMMLATRSVMNMSDRRRRKLSARLSNAVHLKATGEPST